MKSKVPTRQQVRVLIVDDEDRVRRDLIAFLEDEGYALNVPEAAGQVLFELAKEQARAFRPHVAIVDISLDGSPANRSGLALLEELKSAWCILYSGNLSWEIAREIQRKYPKVTWVNKEEKFQSLLDQVREKAGEVSASERKLSILKTKGWSEITLKALLGKNTVAPTSLVDDILAQLFPQSNRIRLESLDQSVVTLQSVSRGRSAVMKGFRDGKFEPYLVKLAPADAIEREARNYSEYIEGNLIGRFKANLVGQVVFWDLGGVLYSFLDHASHPMTIFRDHYDQAEDVRSIVTPLRHFYTVTWGELYKQSTTAEEELGAYYDRVFKLTGRMQAFKIKDEHILFPTLNIPILNPVRWLSKHIHDCSGIPYRLSVTHGDLHSENLFVDGEHAWVIDFERTGPGHNLRDFIEMEVDLFTRLGPGTGGEELNSELFLSGLILTSRFTPILDHNLFRRITHPALRKVLEVIQEHRKLCGELIHVSNFREYLWGLLFDLVFVVTLSDQNTAARDRALLLGGLICERLRHGTREWPDEDLLQAAALRGPAPAPIPADNERKTVFISYAHKDRKWLEKVQTHLKGLEHLGVKIIVWDDTWIAAGSKWQEEIHAALSASKVAILLVSANFLASSFIHDEELPPLLKAVASGGTTILPVILKPCLFASHPDLSAYQSVNDPARPLSRLPKPEQDEILVSLTARIRDLVG